jgi:hypothetical protein
MLQGGDMLQGGHIKRVEKNGIGSTAAKVNRKEHLKTKE